MIPHVIFTEFTMIRVYPLYLALWTNSLNSAKQWCFVFCNGLIQLVELGWIQLDPFKHDWRLLKAFLSFPHTVGSVGVMVLTPDWESVGCEFLLLERKA